MPGAQRKITITFDGTARGLLRAVRQAVDGMEKFDKQVKQTAATTSAASIGGGLVDALGALPSQLKGAAIVAAAGIGVVMAPALASAIISGVLLAVGGGVLAAGIVSAAKSPKVTAAWQKFGQQASKTFERFGEPFIKPLVRAADTFTRALRRAEPTIRRIGQVIAPVVDKLAPALASMVERALPGILAAAQASVPLFGVLADHLPGIGGAIAQFFQTIAAGAPGAQLFFGNFLGWLENAIPKLAGVVTWVQDLNPKIQSVTDRLNPMREAFEKVGSFIASGFKEAREMLHRWLDANNEKIDRFIKQLSGFVADTGPAFRITIIGVALSLQASANAVLAFVDALDRLKRWYNENKSWLMIFMGAIPWISNGDIGIPGLGQRAHGGRVLAGRSYLVGEGGEPEILTMGAQSGYVTPMSKVDTESESSGDTLVVENHIEIGGEVVRVVRTEIKNFNRGLKRAVVAGAR